MTGSDYDPGKSKEEDPLAKDPSETDDKDNADRPNNEAPSQGATTAELADLELWEHIQVNRDGVPITQPSKCKSAETGKKKGKSKVEEDFVMVPSNTKRRGKLSDEQKKKITIMIELGEDGFEDYNIV